MPSPIIAGGKRSPLLRLQRLATEVTLELVNNPPDDPDEYIPIILGLKQVAGEIAVARREADQALIKRTVRGEHRFASWVVKRSRLYDRRDWKHEDLALSLRSAGAGLVEVIRCAGISYWRGDRVKDSGTFEWGVDRDEYCRKTEQESVTIEKARL